MHVRPGAVEDHPAVSRGMEAVAGEVAWLATEPAASAAELKRRFFGELEGGAPLIVLEDDGRIVGSIALRPTAIAGVCAIGAWILPSHRGRGGGRILMEAALAARPADVHRIVLEVWADNDAATRLYESLGFEPDGLRSLHSRQEDGALRAALVMARSFE